VTREEVRPDPAPAEGAVVNHLPAPITRIVGRDDTIAGLATQLGRRRFLTIVGPGGIGKTTVAIAVADNVRASYKDGVWFVGLASLADPDLVPSALGSALGIPPSGADPLRGLAAWLRDKTALIVLDSCEHVIDATAALAEAVLRAAPAVSILTTSREPLRAEGESLHRLAALELPADSVNLAASDALHYSAVQLFNERAMAAVDGFVLADADVPAVLEICRRLDGIPLALELAAARVDVFGVYDLAAHLDDRFRLLTSGRRTALPRHQTLGAALDWSYQLLREEEQAVLHRLSVFVGNFALEAAVAVAADPAPSEIVDHVANLVSKSLVAADPRGEVAQYRPLDTTRLYAFEKLKSSGELRQVARRHAEYYRDLFAPAEAESESRPQAEWVAIYGRHLDNVRAALDWAFSPEGDPHIGVGLTVAVVPLWEHLSLLGECRERVERALAVLEGDEAATARPRMQLSRALGWSLMYGIGRARGRPRLDQDARARGTARRPPLPAERAVESVHRSIQQWRSSRRSRIRATPCRFGGTVRRLDRLDDRRSSPRHGAALLWRSTGDAPSYRLCPRPAAALTQQPQIVRVRFDMRVSTHYFQARILWLQGFAQQGCAWSSITSRRGTPSGRPCPFAASWARGHVR
jgi:predicted ATPase